MIYNSVNDKGYCVVFDFPIGYNAAVSMNLTRC